MTDKTEKPTAQRLRRAREQGDVPVSSAVVSAASLSAAVLMLPWTAESLAKALQTSVESAVRGEPLTLLGVLIGPFFAVVPLLCASALAALTAGGLQTQALLTFANLSPKFEKLNPIEGIKRLFKPDRLFQVLRALLALLLSVYLTGRLLVQYAPSIGSSLGQVRVTLPLFGQLATRLLWQFCLLNAALAALDLLVTRSQWLKRNRMSKEEVKREYRESEGDPQLKHERKRAHQEAMDHATVLSLKDADVLIVNPTHIAVGLRYDEELDAAPRIVATGQEHLAKMLIEAARDYGIPVVRDIPVARALYELSIGEEIPEELFEAVAEILRGLMQAGELETPKED